MSSEVLVLLGSIGRSQSLADAIGRIARYGKAREDKVPRNQLVVGAWRVFCYLCTLTLFFSRLITTWRAVERFFAEFFGFLFNYTSQCYLVFSSLFPTLKLYFILLIIDEYGLG